MHPDAGQRLPSALPFHDALRAIAGVDYLASSILGHASDGTEASAGAATTPTLSEPAVDRAQRRRKFPRAPYITPCRVLRDGFPALDGRSEDISAGGLLLLLPQSLVSSSMESADPNHSGALPKSDEIVRVRFALPTSGVVVEQQAHVRWVRDARGRAALGLEFLEAAPEVFESISKYVAIISGAPSVAVAD
jgi:c-di-GMP-binding flagellar brake protein YcgR